MICGFSTAGVCVCGGGANPHVQGLTVNVIKMNEKGTHGNCWSCIFLNKRILKI